MGDDVETMQRALDALPADRVAHIKSLKEPWDKGVAKMKHWVGAEVVGICGALADELDFMKSLVRAAHEASCSLSSDGAIHSFRIHPMNVKAKDDALHCCPWWCQLKRGKIWQPPARPTAPCDTV